VDESLEEEIITSDNKKPWPIIIGVIAITLVAIMLVPDDTPEKQDNPLPPTSISADSAIDAMPKGKREGDYARLFIKNLKGKPNAADAAFNEAEAQQKQNKKVDAYLLYFYAARERHTDAALALGTMADPAHFSADKSSSTAPDIRQANKWYMVAATSGSDLALERLTNLRTKVETDAAAGDASATRLMLQWK